jgi:CopG family transcriptional regulator, nickel-responsive regulator
MGFEATRRLRGKPVPEAFGGSFRMQRFTISLDEDLAQQFDRLIAARGYGNRSEAVRDMLRAQLEALRLERDEARYCVANLSYVYNHHERALAERLTQLQHEHHDLVVATMHAHLDHDHCIETLILKGLTRTVRRFADVLSAERGVRHSKLNLVSTEIEPHTHRHQGATQDPHEGAHRHFHPKT